MITVIAVTQGRHIPLVFSELDSSKSEGKGRLAENNFQSPLLTRLQVIMSGKS